MAEIMSVAEDHRDKVTLILAGYKDDLEQKVAKKKQIELYLLFTFLFIFFLFFTSISSSYSHLILECLLDFRMFILRISMSNNWQIYGIHLCARNRDGNRRKKLQILLQLELLEELVKRDSEMQELLENCLKEQ